MGMKLDNNKVLSATKWSAITEIVAKLLVPITNMILARLLAPEAYGVVATVTMVISFAEIFSDAGFQKYLVQKEFQDEQEQSVHVNIAFWTNLAVSLAIWLVICVFCDPIAAMVGSPGHGILIVVAGASLPVLAFSSIQMALLRRQFAYKKLFKIRMVSIAVPFCVTIPLAICGAGYWALIVGTLCGNVANAVVLIFLTKWRPQFTYSFRVLKEMFSFSIWSTVEAFTVWLTNWADIFIVGQVLSSYFLGIYKTAPSTIGGIVGIVTGTTTNILFASLSRLQTDEEAYRRQFFSFQRIVAILVLPMGVGIFLFRDMATDLLLGSKWQEAELMMGLWGLTSAFVVIYSNYASEIYRSKGKPMYSALVQVGHILALIPVCWIYANRGFQELVVARCLIRFQLIAIQLLVLGICFRFPVLKLIRQNIPAMACAGLMGVCGYGLRSFNSSIWWNFFVIFLCVVIYVLLLCVTKTGREDISNAKKALFKKKQ